MFWTDQRQRTYSQASVFARRSAGSPTLSYVAERMSQHFRLRAEFSWLIQRIRPLFHWHVASFLAITQIRGYPQRFPSTEISDRGILLEIRRHGTFFNWKIRL